MRGKNVLAWQLITLPSPSRGCFPRKGGVCECACADASLQRPEVNGHYLPQLLSTLCLVFQSSCLFCWIYFFKICTYLIFTYSVCAHACVSENNFVELAFSFHYVLPGARTQILGLSGKPLYPLSHLVSPFLFELFA